jgi:hypothetical protein
MKERNAFYSLLLFQWNQYFYWILAVARGFARVDVGYRFATGRAAEIVIF